MVNRACLCFAVYFQLLACTALNPTLCTLDGTSSQTQSCSTGEAAPASVLLQRYTRDSPQKATWQSCDCGSYDCGGRRKYGDHRKGTDFTRERCAAFCSAYSYAVIETDRDCGCYNANPCGGTGASWLWTNPNPEESLARYDVLTTGTCAIPLTESECALVAEAIDADGGNVNPTQCNNVWWSDTCAPSGCYQRMTNQKVYYNTVGNGECTSRNQCLCKVAPAEANNEEWTCPSPDGDMPPDAKGNFSESCNMLQDSVNDTGTSAKLAVINRMCEEGTPEHDACFGKLQRYFNRCNVSDDTNNELESALQGVCNTTKSVTSSVDLPDIVKAVAPAEPTETTGEERERCCRVSH